MSYHPKLGKTHATLSLWIALETKAQRSLYGSRCGLSFTEDL
ncbi:hypothetical protein [Leptospira noguchii]|nr:hypothetical protein [Leptospira noguchii]